MRTFFNQLSSQSPLCLCCGYQKNAKQGFCLGCYHDLPHIKQDKKNKKEKKYEKKRKKIKNNF